MNNYTLNDPIDSIWDPGETVDIIVDLGNSGIDATNVMGVLSTTDSYINITDNTFDFGSISNSSTSNNLGNPYKAIANSSTPSSYTVEFNLHITADGGYSKNIPLTGTIGITPGIIVDEFDACGNKVYGLAFDGTNLWVSDAELTSIKKLNPETGSVLGEIPTPENRDNCLDIAWDGTNLWVHNVETKKIYKVNSSNGAVITSFNSPATQYPTGLTFDGEHLWVTDRDTYKIYKLTTSGSTVTSFDIPAPKPSYGPRCLAFEPKGPDGGSLLLFMTHYTGTETLDSTVVWEISRDGSLVADHHFETPPTNGRAIEVNSAEGIYWVNSWDPNKIYEVTGFYRHKVGIEESLPKTHLSSLTISPNPSGNKISISFYMDIDKKVSLNIYDIAGKLVKHLGIKSQSGNYRVFWDGKNDNNKLLPNGIYFCKLESNKIVETKKIILIQ